MTTAESTKLVDLKKKLERYLRQESTVYFKIEKLARKNLTDSALESRAKFLNNEITKLQEEIKQLATGDMV